MINDDIIRLRALEPEDLECLYQWENDMDLWEVSDTLTPFSLFTLKKYIETCHLDIYAGIGIMIHNTENQKQGYATAAIRLMIDYCFETLGLNQIYSSVPSGNIGSRKLFEKLGFVQTGYRKNWLRRGNGWEDIVYFQLLNQ